MKGFSKMAMIVLMLAAIILTNCYGAPVPPNPSANALTARELVHKSNWASFGTLSTEEVIKGYPMVNMIAIADSGKDEASTGNIYFYLMDLDFTGKDWKADNKVTIMLSEEQWLECSKEKQVNPMDPRCRRVYLSGEVTQLTEDTDIHEAATKAFQSRHPASVRWPTLGVHPFYLAKLEIKKIYLMDGFGGAKDVPVADYYNAPSQ